MPRAETPDWIMTFMRAVYPDAPHLALASFNEKKVLTDASERIAALELANRELIGLLAEARGAVLKRRIDAARGELWGVVKDCDDLLARIDARIGGKE
jgi:hypothetical protein